MLQQLHCYFIMHSTTNTLLILIIVTITSFLTHGALQHKYPHGGSYIPTERAALLSFKKGVTSYNTDLLASWHGQDCCRWRGVRCSNRTGHVIKLQLRNPNLDRSSPDGYADENALFGQISPSLLTLENIEHIDLSMNCFTEPNSSFPEFLGSIKNLKYLNLSGIPFTGTIPPQLGNLSKLQYLDLGQATRSQMYSTNITWLTNLPLLQFLSMSRVNLTVIADWPHMLNMIPSLKVVSLLGCSLHSANQLLPHLNLTKLEKLDLSFNDFNHSIASCWFMKVTSLKYLNLWYNRLFGPNPYAIGNMTSLQVLDLSYNLNKYMMMTENLKYLCSLEILDLTNNEIDGDITLLMKRLSQCAWEKLQELHFGYNSFTGILPNSTGKFTSLNVLQLANNKLTGSIPPWIGYLTRITSLDISHNLFTESVPSEIGGLTSMIYLDLSNNDFSGSVPSEIGALTNLTSLDLSNNNFSGVITEKHFASIISLKNIDLFFNSLKIIVDSDWVPPFKLESALFTSCQMGRMFPTWLQQQQLITKLDISRTAIRDKVPDWFWSTFSQATYLDMSNNQISGSMPKYLDGMDFEEFNISSNEVTGPIPPLPRNITILDISSNAFSGTLPSNLEAPQLQALVMYSNQIAGNIPESICKLPQLIDIDLSNNLLEGEIPRCSEMESMSYLLLSNNSLSGTFLEFLQNLEDLEFLDLAWNKFSERLPSWIGEMRRLRFLRLSHNAFSGTIPVEITNLNYLQYLDLSGNNISGVIPWHLSNLTGMTLKDFSSISGTNIGDGLVSLTISGQFGEIMSKITKGQQLRYGGSLAYFVSIDLSGNSLAGEVFTDITSLDALINLNLSSNLLSGTISDKIGHLQSLESLDLSKNKLCGGISSSVSNLTSLSYLNLSYNNLSGRIPSGRQLDTLNVDNPWLMYIGNNELCGPPLQKNCSKK